MSCSSTAPTATSLVSDVNCKWTLGVGKANMVVFSSVSLATSKSVSAAGVHASFFSLLFRAYTGG